MTALQSPQGAAAPADARSEILDRIRRAQSAAGARPAPQIVRAYRREGENPPGSQPVLDEFVEALRDYDAQVQVVQMEQAAAAIAAELADVNSVVIPAGLPQEWAEVAARDGRQVIVDSPTQPLTNRELDGIDAVITESACAISLSGTIVLDGEANQGRRALSLVPDTHVCIVYADTVQPTVPQAVELLGQHPTRPFTWIAGPSATSDIELVRVSGVHGPRKLRVVIIRR